MLVWGSQLGRSRHPTCPHTEMDCVCLLSRVQLFLTLWTFSRQEYRSGLSCPPPGDLPDPGIEPASSASAGGVFTACHLGSLTWIRLPVRINRRPEQKGLLLNIKELLGRRFPIPCLFAIIARAEIINTSYAASCRVLGK